MSTKTLNYKLAIIEAINDLNSRSGSSLFAIRRAMKAKSPDRTFRNSQFLKTIRAGVAAGDFVQIKGAVKLSKDFKQHLITLSKKAKQKGRPPGKQTKNGSSSSATSKAASSSTKMDSLVADSNTLLLTPSTPKKRGRPKKTDASSAPVIAKPEPTAGPSPSLQKKRGRPQGSKNGLKVKPKLVKAKVAPLSSEQTQKKRGRPKKSDVGKVKNGKSPNKGRPRKAMPTKPKSPSSAKKTSKPKINTALSPPSAVPLQSPLSLQMKQGPASGKKRGRPPKVSVVSAASVPIASLQDGSVAPGILDHISKESMATVITEKPLSTGKRGRPKKSDARLPAASTLSPLQPGVIPPSVSQLFELFQSHPQSSVHNPTDVPTKKRGRPKKVLTVEELAAKATPKKRGRPKKITSLDTTNLSEKNGVITESRQTNLPDFPVAVSMSIISTTGQHEAEAEAVVITEVVAEEQLATEAEAEVVTTELLAETQVLQPMDQADI